MVDRRSAWALVAAEAAYVLATLALHGMLHPADGALAIVPTLVAAWAFGPRTGATTGLLNGFFAFALDEVRRLEPLAIPQAAIVLVLVVVGFGVGIVGDLARQVRAESERLADEVARRRDAQERLARALRAQNLHARIGEAALRARDVDALYADACRIAVEDGGFDLAWIGIVDDEGEVRPVARAGAGGEYVSDLHVTTRFEKAGLGPTGRAIRERAPVVSNDITHDPLMAPWRERARERGLLSSASLPLAQGDRVIGALSLYARETDAFPPDVVASLETVANDVAFASSMLRESASRRRAEEAVRESEARFRQLAEHVGEVFFVITPDLARVEYASPAYEAVTGRSLASLAEAPSSWLDAIVPEDRDALLERFTVDVLAGRPAKMEFRFVHADGSLRWARIYGAPVLTHDQEVARIVGVVEDITERKSAEAATRRAEASEREVEKLREIAAFKTRFLNAAAHELATPLTPIRLQLEMLRRELAGPLSPEQRRAVDTLDRNLARLIVLVRDLVDAARIESGKPTMRYRDASSAALVTHARDAYAPHAREAGVELKAEPHGDITFEADPDRLAQALGNLVENAIESTPRGGSVRVSCEAAEGELVVRVADSGVGLTREQMARLFEPFADAHEPAVGARTRTGLGLALSRAIVAEHGGRIWCESAGPGKGATFSFAVPLRKRSSDVPLVAQRSSSSA